MVPFVKTNSDTIKLISKGSDFYFKVKYEM